MKRERLRVSLHGTHRVVAILSTRLQSEQQPSQRNEKAEANSGPSASAVDSCLSYETLGVLIAAVGGWSRIGGAHAAV